MKKLRHKKILSLIKEKSIDRQEILLEYLKDEGFDVTQATVSRDIKELNLVKIVSSNGGYKYAQNVIVQDTKESSNRFDFIFSESIITVDYAINTVVIKCRTAMAQAACEVFDSLVWEGVVGTLAGENTIFIVTKTEKNAETLTKQLREYIK